MGLRSSISGASKLRKAILIFAVAVLPPLAVLLNARSTDPFMYGAAIVGGTLAFAVKMLDEEA